MSKQFMWTIQKVVEEPDNPPLDSHNRAVAFDMPGLRVTFTESYLLVEADGAGTNIPWTLIGRCVVPEPKPLCNCERCGRLLMTNSTGNFRSSLDADGNVQWTGVCIGCLRDDED